MDRAQSRARGAYSGSDDRRRRPRPRVGGPSGDRSALRGSAGAAGDHDPGRTDAVAGDDRRDGPDRGPQEPMAHAGALDPGGDLYRNSAGDQTDLIAVISNYDIIDVISCPELAYGQPDHPKTR